MSHKAQMSSNSRFSAITFNLRSKLILIIGGLALVVLIASTSYYFGMISIRTTIKGIILDYNSVPLDNPDVTINSLYSTDKCKVEKTGHFICSVLLNKDVQYDVSLNDRKNNRAFMLQYLDSNSRKNIDLGIRKAPW